MTMPKTASHTTSTVTKSSHVSSVDHFLDKLATVNPSASILSTVMEHSDRFIPKSCTQELPLCLSSLYDAQYLDLSYHELIAKSLEVYDSIAVDVDQAVRLEEVTKKQSKSKLWFRFRAGRVTASRFKAAASTNVAQPSQSLIKQICYPESQQFKTAATR